MATDSPITISSWHRRHLRKRAAAEAFTSAVYYSECSLGGISPKGAATAEENVRMHHSRWWLSGNDPKHPTLQSIRTSLKTVNSKSSGEDDFISRSDEATEPADESDNNRANRTLVEAADYVHDAVDHVVGPHADNSNSPIFVHDNDYGLSFGTLGNFSTERILPTVPSRSSTPPPLISNYLTQSQTSSAGKTTQSQHGPAQTISESESDGVTSSYCRRNCDAGYSSVPRLSRKRYRTYDSTPFDQTAIDSKIASAKSELLSTLQQEGISPAFKKALDSLERCSNLNSMYNNKRELRMSSSSQDGCTESTNIDGTWRMISPPEYPSSLGKNTHGDGLFTLGRMSFDIFQPSDLICSIQKQYNTIQSVEPSEVPLYVPRRLIREVADGRNVKCRGGLKTYNIIVLFTIEQANTSNQDQPKEPLRGVLTNYGYALPDPTHPNRKSIWFTGGTIEPAQEYALDEWKRIFGANASPTNSSNENDDPGCVTDLSTLAEAEKARILASKIMLGVAHEPMDDRGVVGFHLKRPIGGHGSAYCDVIYMDEDVRVMRGHSGSIYVFKKE